MLLKNTDELNGLTNWCSQLGETNSNNVIEKEIQ